MLSNLPPDFGTGARIAASLGRLVRSVTGRTNHTSRRTTDGPTGQISTITAANGTASSLYQMRVRGSGTAQGLDVTVNFTPAASSAVGVQAVLLAAVQASALLYGYCASVAASSTDKVVLTAVEGAEFTVSFPTNPSSHLSVGYTDATERPQYLYGRAVEVVAAPSSVDGILDQGVRNPVAIAGAVLHVAIGHTDPSDDFSVQLLVDAGQGAQVETIAWVAGANAGATDAAAVVALEASDYIADAAIDSEGVLTVTGMPGVTITVLGAAAEDTSTLTVEVNTQADVLPTFALVRDDGAPILDAMPQTVPVGPLPGHLVPCADPSGSNWYAVEAPAASITGTDVWVETDDSGDNLGRLFDSATKTDTCTPWLEPKWAGIDPNDPSIAWIQL